ncbi:MAG TPA: tetratricopeptide repeat protein [Polyangiaceae bacterium]
MSPDTTYCVEDGARIETETGPRLVFAPILRAWLVRMNDDSTPSETSYLSDQTHAIVASAIAHYDRGVRLAEQGQVDAAIQSYTRAIDLDPKYPQPLNNLGALFLDDGRLVEARRALERAVALAPEYPEAWNNLGVLARDEGNMAEAYRCYERSLQADRNARNTQHNLLMAENYLTDFELEWMQDDHLAWGEQVQERYLQPPLMPTRPFDPTRPLRIGYLSPDFRTHSVGYFIEAMLANHDPAFHSYCYANLPREDDPTTLRLRSLAFAWRNVHSLSAAELAALIRRDEIDVLVELAGHTAGNRLDAMALRPAPVQITYLGYPNTTGLRCIDYRITDEHADPWDTKQYFAETLIRMPECFLCYTPPLEGPAVNRLPLSKRGYVTFVSFNALCKLNDRVLEVWARILNRVPRSRLLLKARGLANPTVAKRLKAKLKHFGIAPHRITFEPLVATNYEHLAQYNRADISLDTFPYAGTTTTCEALLMGVPVVTLTGRTHANNVGRSILHAVGLPELLADTDEQYVDIACELAVDRKRLTAMRRTLRERMLGSALCDGWRFTREIEAVYAWCVEEATKLQQHVRVA